MLVTQAKITPVNDVKNTFFTMMECLILSYFGGSIKAEGEQPIC